MPLATCRLMLQNLSNHNRSVRWQNSLVGRVARQSWPHIDKARSNALCNLSRRDCSLVIRSLTGHWLIGIHAQRLNSPYNDFCRSCRDEDEEESPEHFFCFCPALSSRRFRFLEYAELRREIDGLRRYIEELGEHLKASQESLAKETKAEIGLLAEKVGTQNAYLRQILQRGAQSTEAQGSTFPISSPEEMMALDLKISPENRQIYITKMKELLLQANLSKSIKKVLGEEKGGANSEVPTDMRGSAMNLNSGHLDAAHNKETKNNSNQQAAANLKMQREMFPKCKGTKIARTRLCANINNC
ncbi:hypothetical protein ACLKA6_019233 [Drosophila palustris]